MRTLFVIVFAANLVLTLVSLIILPSHVAINFGPGGAPGPMVPNYVHALCFLMSDILLFGVFFFSPNWALRMSPDMVSLPNKEYWLKEENKPVLKRKLESLMSQFGVAFLVFMFLVQVLMIRASLGEPVRLEETYFLVGLGGLFVYVGYWLYHVHSSLKIPQGGDTLQARNGDPNEGVF